MFYDNFIKSCNFVGKSPSLVLQEAGIDKSAASRWKKGKCPTDATLRKLADYFGVSPTDLTGETYLKVSRGEVLPADILTPEASRIARAYDRADAHTKSLVQLALKPYSDENAR